MKISFIIFMILLFSSASPLGWDTEAKDQRIAEMKTEAYNRFIVSLAGKAMQKEYITQHITHNELITLYIWEYSAKYEVDPYLSLALCHRESKFNPYARSYNKNSKTWDRGLFQLNSKYYPDIPGVDYFDIQTNCELGVKHLAWSLNSFPGDMSKGVQAYNAGYGTVTNDLVCDATMNYTQDILELESDYQKGFDIFLLTNVGF